MDYTVCSRETERDYTWDNAHASSSLTSFARDTLAPAFEGSLTTSRFAAFLRCPGSPNGVILGVSVSTERVDFRHRPIRTMAFFRAENPDEEKLLASFFAECLRKKDEETLSKPESGVAKAVESLYQTKKTDEFIKFCKGLPKAVVSGTALAQRWAIPRDNLDDRKNSADALPALTKGGSPFLLALTDRLPTDVLASLGSMFDRGTVWIFSEATTVKEPIPGGSPNTRAVAAAIGGTVLFAVLFAAAIGGPCSRRGGGGEAVRATNAVNRTESGGACLGNSATNVSPSKGVAETNAPTGEGGGGTNAPPSRNNPNGFTPSTEATVTTNKPSARVSLPNDPSVQH